jgi:hypothetical protein
MNTNYKLSTQGMAVIMTLLQKCLMEQIDIVPMFQDLLWYVNDKDELTVSNPPTSMKLEIDQNINSIEEK